MLVLIKRFIKLTRFTNCARWFRLFHIQFFTQSNRVRRLPKSAAGSAKLDALRQEDSRKYEYRDWHGVSLRSIYGTFSLRMRSSRAYFCNDNSLIMKREFNSIH